MKVGAELVPGGLRVVDQRGGRSTRGSGSAWVEGRCEKCGGLEWCRRVPAWGVRWCGQCIGRRLRAEGNGRGGRS